MQLSPLMNLNIPAPFLSPSLLLTRACSEVALAFSLDRRLARPHAAAVPARLSRRTTPAYAPAAPQAPHRPAPMSLRNELQQAQQALAQASGGRRSRGS